MWDELRSSFPSLELVSATTNSFGNMFGTVLRRRALNGAVVRCRVSSKLMRYYADWPKHDIIKMPALSPTMTQGNIGAWQKKPGDTISPGDVLVEIETDKAQMDFEFQDEGVIAKVLKESGEKDVRVGNVRQIPPPCAKSVIFLLTLSPFQPIAVLVEEGTDVSAFEKFTIADAGGDVSAAAAKEEPEEPAEPPPTPVPMPAVESEDKAASPAKLQTALDREPNMSAAAKRLAIENGISVSKLKGSGAGGRITEDDVKQAISTFGGAVVSVATPAASYTDMPISGMRKVIAQRLTESTQQNPHYFVSSSISVTKLLKLRQALNSGADGRYKLSVNDFFVKAIGIACKKVPTVNSSWRDGFIRQFNTVDVSVAVSTPTGLITPIVPAVDTKGLEAISNSVRELAKRGRDGKLKPEEYQGGSISISNMGMNPAIERFSAVINPPQAAILAVGTTKKVAIPVETDDGTSVEWDDQINVTASFDHKVVDGAVGAEWIRELKKVIENPIELLL